MDEEPKPIQPSRSGGAGRDKDERKQPGRRSPSRAARQARTLALGAILGLAEDAFARDVAAGQITAQQVEACRTTLTAVLDCLPIHAVERLLPHVKGFAWYATHEMVDRAYREEHRDSDETSVVALYDPIGRVIHLSAECILGDYAHEVSHAVDGPNFDFTGTSAWIVAYNAERGRLGSEAYPTSSPQEWWAALASILLADPEAWDAIRQRLPRSTPLLERVFHD